MDHPFPITPETEKSWMRSNAETFAPWSSLRDDPEEAYGGEPIVPDLRPLVAL
jgi:hypothetical protein